MMRSPSPTDISNRRARRGTVRLFYFTTVDRRMWLLNVRTVRMYGTYCTLLQYATSKYSYFTSTYQKHTYCT